MRDRITRMTIERFRGVGEVLTLDLDADIVLIEGANGTGKSTIADAIAWCILGQLPGARERQAGEARKHDPVVSAYCSGASAKVTMEVRVQGRTLRVVRSGNGASSTMSVTEISAGEGGSASGHRFADALRQGDGDTLSRWMTSVVLLRQQTLQRFIYDAADSRYSQLRSLLGLGTLDDFEAAARQTKDSLGRRARHASEQLAHVRARLEEREAGLARTQQVSSSGWSDALQTRLKELLQSPSPNIGAQLPERVDAESVARIGRDVSIALEATQEIAAVFPGGEVAQNNLRQALAEAERTVDGATRAVSAAMDAAPWQQLAGAALGLLDDRCPVCEQSIEQNSVRIRLRTVLSRAAADAERLGEAQRVLEAARAEVAHLQVQVDRRQKDEAMWGLARDRWNSQISRLTEISVQAPNERADAEALISVLVDLRQELRMLYLDVSAPASRSEVERIQREVEEVRAAVRVAEIEQLEAERAAASARELEKAAMSVGLDMTIEALDRLTPAFQRVYDRLAPHPTFRDFRLVHTIAFRKGRSSAEVTDPAVGIATNPSVVFSEGQLNSLAVGMFAALSLSVDVPVPFIMLDDPMQSVDGANVLGVADLCRELGVKRQLLVTTHDRRFAAVLTRKLAPREEHSKAIVLRLRGWRPQGPDVETYQLPVSVPPILGVA